jgi:Uncharacterized protein conserved in bacteria
MIGGDSAFGNSKVTVRVRSRVELVMTKYCKKCIQERSVLYMADIKYEIIKEIGILSENAKGWRKELNLISWNDAAPKYDIRDWAPNHEKMGKGVTLTKEEIDKLKEIL